VESAGAPFACTSYAVNPGVAACFPWLSQVAQRYETYKFRELCFHYHTRAATTQVGTVGLVFDFDAQDPAPSSQMEALSYHDKAADSCWKEINLRLDLAQGDRLPVRYTRPGLPASPYDLKTLDLGNVHVFTDGVAASTNLGLLEAVYTIDLYTPQIQNPVGGSVNNTTAMDATHLVGTTNTVDAQAILPVRFTSSAVMTFTQCWEGIMTYYIAGTVLSADFAPVASASGVATNIGQTVDAASQVVRGSCRIRAVPGTTLTPTITATTVTNSVFGFGSGAYVQFG
jgi:hypothetical protein